MITTRFQFTTTTADWRKGSLAFSYAVRGKGIDYSFTEPVQLPRAVFGKDIPEVVLQNLLRDLHLALGISYYKAFLSATIEHPYQLTRDQAAYWETVYQKGLAELRYRNDLDPRVRVAFKSTTRAKSEIAQLEVADTMLIGVGGGKESAIMLDMADRFGFPREAFVARYNRGFVNEQQLAAISKTKLWAIDREIDPQVLRGIPDAYNGHLPISMITAWLGVLAAVAYGFRYVAVGNEASSAEATLKYKGFEINHQWSKSPEFELLTQEYLKRYVTPSVQYFSLLRPYTELRLAQMFAKLPEAYHRTFLSCGRSFRVAAEQHKPVWCGECIKCSYIFLALSAWMPRKKVEAIFGKNLLNDSRHIQTYADMCGWGSMKPFDCVGTFAENRVAMKKVAEKYPNSVVVTALKDRIATIQDSEAEALHTVAAPTMPARFLPWGASSVVLVGYGKEGKAAHAWLKKQYPHLKITTADRALHGETYLERQHGADLIIRTPGVHVSKIRRPHTTAVNIFLSTIQNTVIGITGSKGKSTTSTLIYEMLRAAKKPARLVGNIGLPVLKELDTLKSNEIVVIELSSYMLEDVQTAPDVGVVTALFPEHLDYHGSLEKYYEAKHNMIRLQHAEQVYIHATGFPDLKRWEKTAVSEVIAPAESLPIEPAEIPLQGAHNISNIRLAVAAVRLFGVSDAAIAKAVRNFRGLPHRLQNIGTYRGITFIDDAISTSPESTIQALRALRGKVDTIFLGGTDRGYDFAELEKELRKQKVRNILLFPDSGERVLKSEKGFTVLHTKSMQEAVAFAYAQTQKGKTCLLSCASPSYSLWKNFEAKGEEFQKLVKQLAKSKDVR